MDISNFIVYMLFPNTLSALMFMALKYWFIIPFPYMRVYNQTG